MDTKKYRVIKNCGYGSVNDIISLNDTEAARLGSEFVTLELEQHDNAGTSEVKSDEVDATATIEAEQSQVSSDTAEIKAEVEAEATTETASTETVATQEGDTSEKVESSETVQSEVETASNN